MCNIVEINTVNGPIQGEIIEEYVADTGKQYLLVRLENGKYVLK